MNTVKRIAMTVGGIVMLAMILAVAMPKAAHAIVSTLVTIANTSSDPVPVQVVKQSTANVVNLAYDASNLVYDELLPNGTLVPYSIPAGEQLVITDINWEALCNEVRNSQNNLVPCPSAAGDGVTLVLQFSPTSYYFGSFTSQAIFASVNGVLAAGKSESLRTGIAVNQLPAPGILNPNESVNVITLNLSGYLIP